MYVQRNNEARSRVVFVMEKQYILHICVCVCVCARAFVLVPDRVSVCMRVAFLIQYATRMRHVVMSVSCVASLAPLYISTLSHKWNDFRKKSY